jgi:hypothetical protein
MHFKTMSCHYFETKLQKLVDGWEGHPYMRLHQHGAAGSSGPLVLLEDFGLVAK